jgi:hypothetical protein
MAETSGAPGPSDLVCMANLADGLSKCDGVGQRVIAFDVAKPCCHYLAGSAINVGRATFIVYIVDVHSSGLDT